MRTVAKGQNLEEGAWYRITEIAESDPSPTLSEGDVVRCVSERAGCIDPKNVSSDDMGVEWFADYNGEAFGTLIVGLELVAEASSPLAPCKPEYTCRRCDAVRACWVAVDNRCKYCHVCDGCREALTPEERGIVPS